MRTDMYTCWVQMMGDVGIVGAGPCHASVSSIRTWHGVCQLCVDLCQDRVAQKVKDVKPNLNTVHFMHKGTHVSLYSRRKSLQHLNIQTLVL